MVWEGKVSNSGGAVNCVNDAVLGVSFLLQSIDNTSCFGIQQIELSTAVTCTKNFFQGGHWKLTR